MKQNIVLGLILSSYLFGDISHCNNAKSCLKEANRLIKEKQYINAKEAYRRSCDLAGENNNIHSCYKLGKLQEELKEYREARVTYSKSCGLNRYDKACKKEREMRVKIKKKKETKLIYGKI